MQLTFTEILVRPPVTHLSKKNLKKTWNTISTELQSFPISPRQDGLKWAASQWNVPIETFSGQMLHQYLIPNVLSLSLFNYTSWLWSIDTCKYLLPEHNINFKKRDNELYTHLPLWRYFSGLFSKIRHFNWLWKLLLNLPKLK